MQETLIQNATIYDGTGCQPFHADVLIRGSIIADIGNIPPLPEYTVVDAQGLALSPGFINTHSHMELELLRDPSVHQVVDQGITTEALGQDGSSVAPVTDGLLSELADNMAPLAGTISMPYPWRSYADYMQTVEDSHPAARFVGLVGHGTIRLAAMGFEARKASGREMDTMRALLRQALDDGAFCLSSGLIYPPGCYAGTDELAELCKELVPYGAFYETHMRDEGEGVVDALKEALEISRRSGAPLQVAHHKVVRKSVWQVHCKTTIALIDQARRQGMDVKVDQYPYNASATTLDSNAPLWAFEGGVDSLLARLQDPETRRRINAEANASHVGRWGDIFVSYAGSEKNQWAVGKSILEIAKIRGVDPADACFDLIVEERCRVGEVNYGMCEEDITYIMRQPYTMIGSDGNAASLDYNGQPHPRWYGTFPRVIARYCREKQLFPLETAVFKMTGLPASRLGLPDRGLIKEGMQADLVLFDFNEIEDTPTYQNPKQPCKGIRRVYVNGVLTAQDGVHTGARNGRILRKGRI